MQRYSETVTQSGKFISATYPIAEGEFTNQRIDKKYYGDPVPNLGMIDDAVSIWTWGKLLTKALADKMVGIIPEGYFRYHRKENQTEDFRGIVFPGIPLALVEVGDWTSTAHEIYHTYSWGLGSIGSWARWAQPLGPGEEYETNPPDGNPASGFWVSEGKEVYPFNKETQKGSFCFMGSYATDDSFNYGLNPIWICKEDYITLFKEFRVDKTDPDVILVNGYISKDGTITLKKLYMVEEGKADDIMPGDYSIEVLDNTGQLLTEIPFYTSFYANADPIGTIEMDKAAFAFAIPYPDTTTKIQIQHNGETLVEFNSNSKLLHDAVDSIPDHGFINNTEQRRNALINKIRVVEKTIEEGNLNGAVNMLKFDIKDKFEKWLVDDYQVENPLQFTKDEVIILLDEIIQRLSLMSGRGGAPSPIEFPKETELLQNYPNPPNPETWIPFKLSEESDVTIEIHDVTGHLVRKLTLGYIPAGFYTSKDKAVHWDGKNEAGEKVASGIYFYTIKAGEFKAVRKMTITR